MVAIWSLVQLLIERKYPEAYDRVNQLQFSSKEMSDLVDLLIKKSKERLFDLINVAYSSISVKDMAQTFRITPEEAIKIAKSQGWHLDDSNTFLMPKKKRKILDKFFEIIFIFELILYFRKQRYCRYTESIANGTIDQNSFVY